MSGIAAAIFGCSGPKLSQAEANFFAAAQPWGFILFARNVETPDQLRQLTDDLRAAVGRDAPILIDQEGGRVQRLRAPYWREWLPPLDQINQTSDPERAMYIRARVISDELRDVGIDVNCAPLADLTFPQTHPFLRNRTYGGDPDTVIRLARATADGHLAGGVIPVLKHIPGHGRSLPDSHLDLPIIETSAEELIATDFAPFKALNDLPLGMTGHLIFTAFDKVNPCTVSPKMISVIRRDIGFTGLLMTDDISMQALDGDVATRSAKSIDAGCDLVLHCNGDAAEMHQIFDVCGHLGANQIKTGKAALTRRAAVDDADIPALMAELNSLMNGL